MYQRKITNPKNLINRILTGNLRHWTPQYIFNRLRLEIDFRRNPTDPWLTRDAIKVLKQLLHPDSGFEWGSGRSTVWFANLTKSLTSIENNKVWYEQVSDMLSRNNVDNVDYLWRDTSGISAEGAQNSSYVQAISVFDKASLDYIVIDGFARQWCATISLSKLKNGGILILDNAERYIPPPLNLTSPERIQDKPLNEEWEKFWNDVRGWRKYWTSNGITNTLLMIKK